MNEKNSSSLPYWRVFNFIVGWIGILSGLAVIISSLAIYIEPLTVVPVYILLLAIAAVTLAYRERDVALKAAAADRPPAIPIPGLGLLIRRNLWLALLFGIAASFVSSGIMLLFLALFDFAQNPSANRFIRQIVVIPGILATVFVWLYLLLWIGKRVSTFVELRILKTVIAHSEAEEIRKTRQLYRR